MRLTYTLILFGFGLVLMAPAAHAYRIEDVMHRAAGPQQQQTQAEVIQRARELLEQMEHAEQQESAVPPQLEPLPSGQEFDMGPVEPFAQTQQLEEPVENLPGSGFGISLGGLALGVTFLRHHKRLSKYVSTSSLFAS